jgi:hypothetical protein
MSDASRQPHSDEFGGSAADSLEMHLAARADRERGRLSADAFERIFAASDLQLPVPVGNEHAVVARIGAPSRRAWRVAAAIAALAGTSLIVFLIARGGSTVESESLPGRAIVDGAGIVPATNGATSGVTNGATSSVSRPQLPEPSHFDLALSGALTATKASQSATGAVVALHTAPTAALAVVASSAAWDDPATFASNGDLGAITYDGLSGEFDALLAATPRMR